MEEHLSFLFNCQLHQNIDENESSFWFTWLAMNSYKNWIVKIYLIWFDLIRFDSVLFYFIYLFILVITYCIFSMMHHNKNLYLVPSVQLRTILELRRPNGSRLVLEIRCIVLLVSIWLNHGGEFGAHF